MSGEYLSRRSFLMVSSAASLAGLWNPLSKLKLDPLPENSFVDDISEDPELLFVQPRPARLDLWGRITDPGTPVHDTPGRGSPITSYIHQHTVVPVFDMLEAEGKNANNRLWLHIPAGFVYTANIQLIRPYRMPVEIHEIPTTIVNALGEEQPGFWAQTIVPFTTARMEPSGTVASLADGSSVIHYYGSVHRITEVQADLAGFLWYKVIDDKKGADPVFVLARHMRMLTPDDLAPINPRAKKRIEVSLAEQRLTAYEEDKAVFTTLVASGGDGFDTPKGNHAVVYKQPSRHMYSDPENEAFSDPNYFDLPGVPFNIFFTTLGHAIHGTYWHGDYGRPRSHGCLNVTPEDAEWLFRWVEPVSPYDSMASGSATSPGTPIVIL